MIGVVTGEIAVARTIQAPEESAPAETAETATSDARKVRVSLFYVSDSGLELVPAAREVAYGATISEQARRIVEAQVQAPTQGKVSSIPPQTTVRAVFLGQKGDAYVDLGPEIVANHSGGAINEALTVYAIVNALTTNLTDVRSVQILIDGKEVDTLAGHIDLRRPIVKSDGWIQKASRAASPGGDE